MSESAEATVSEMLLKHPVSDSYVEFIKRVIVSNKTTRAYQSKLAKASKTYTSNFSSSLKYGYKLTLDQASALCDFWEFDSNQSMYFLLLVLRDRASTDSLKRNINVGIAHWYELINGVTPTLN